jgi:hypothetical protein
MSVCVCVCMCVYIHADEEKYKVIEGTYEQNPYFTCFNTPTSSLSYVCLYGDIVMDEADLVGDAVVVHDVRAS